MTLLWPSASPHSLDARRDKIALEAAGLGVWELDIESGNTVWNEQMYALYHLSPSRPAPYFNEWLTYVHPEDQNAVTEAFQHLLVSHTPMTIEFRIRVGGDDVRYLRAVTRSLHNEDDTPQCLVGINEDITQQVHDRHLAANKTRELQNFFDVSPSLICITTLDGQFLTVNQAWTHTLGFSEHELTGTFFLDLVHSEDLTATRDAMAELFEGHVITDFVNRYRHKNGEFRYIEWCATARGNQVYATANDVTSRIALEQQIAKDKAYLQLIIDSLPSPIFAKDWQGRHTLANNNVAALFGMTPDEMLGLTDWQMPISTALAEKFQHDDREVMCSGKHKFIAEELLLDTDGVKHWYQVIKVPLLCERPVEERQVVGIATDITELRQAQQRALSASHAKSQFLANMSHEIRTPLNAMIGYSELLSQSQLNQEQQGWLGNVKTASHLLLSIVNDVLDYSKIEAGKLELESLPFTLEQLIAQQKALFALSSQDKGLDFHICREGDFPPALRGDFMRLGQVLTNLVSNAIKFTQHGSVTLHIRANPVAHDTCQLTFHVIDTGMGISDAQKARLFDAFTQADSSISRRFGGTGLGLVICRRLIEQMGGTLDANSEQGKGSCFSVGLTLPITAEPDAQLSQCDTLDTRGLVGKRVLLAEDNPVNQALTRRLLENLGLAVILVNNGREALEQLQAHDVDLVLMDLQMPEMDGFEAAQRIRQGNKTLPIIALSAAVLDEERQDALAAGMNEHVAKPINFQQLSATVIRWLTSASPAPDTCHELATNAVASAAEDTWLAILESHGFDTQTGLSAAANDRSLYRQVLCLFLDQLKGHYAHLIKSALHKTDATVAAHEDLLQRELHTLKGSAASVGAVELAESACHIETCLKHRRHVHQTDIDQLLLALSRAQCQLTSTLKPPIAENRQ